MIDRLSDVAGAESTSGLMFAVPWTASWCESVIKTAMRTPMTAGNLDQHEDQPMKNDYFASALKPVGATPFAGVTGHQE
jgi:hypothetical protein